MTNAVLLDGKYLRGFYTGSPRLDWPFLNNGDYTSYTVERTWQQSAKVFFPGKQGVDRDPVYTQAYLILESPPEPIGIGDVIRTRRTFALIPATQITYTSRSITKPTIPNEASITISVRTYSVSDTEISTAVRNDTGLWLSDNRVFSRLAGIAVSEQRGYATAGTFTLTYKTSTTAALNYNDTGATIAAALNGLAAVISDGLTFTVTANLSSSSANIAGTMQLALSVGTTTTAVTMTVTGLTVTPVAAKVAFTTIISSTSQVVSVARVMAVASHGFSASSALLLATTATGYVWAVGQWGIYDANTIQFAPGIAAGVPVELFPSSIPTVASYAATYLRTYTPGSTVLSARVTRRFYLPGVSAGVSTAADIPIIVPNIADADVIAAVLTTTGFQPVSFEGPVRWMDSPIYETTEIEINFDNL